MQSNDKFAYCIPDLSDDDEGEWNSYDTVEDEKNACEQVAGVDRTKS